MAHRSNDLPQQWDLVIMGHRGAGAEVTAGWQRAAVHTFERSALQKASCKLKTSQGVATGHGKLQIQTNWCLIQQQLCGDKLSLNDRELFLGLKCFLQCAVG